MAELKFDHSKEDIFKAIGITEEELKEINAKFASLSRFIIVENPSRSKIVEKIAEILSYSELVIATSEFIISSTQKILETHPIISLLSILKDHEDE